MTPKCNLLEGKHSMQGWLRAKWSIKIKKEFQELKVLQQTKFASSYSHLKTISKWEVKTKVLIKLKKSAIKNPIYDNPILILLWSKYYYYMKNVSKKRRPNFFK